jgi:hypothetical protein
MTFCETQHFYGKSSVKFLSHLRHNCVIDQSATENKVIHTLIIDFFSHGLRSVKIEQELEKQHYVIKFVSDLWHTSSVSSTHKTDCHDLTEILLKVVLNPKTLTLKYFAFLKSHNLNTI